MFCNVHIRICLYVLASSSGWPKRHLFFYRLLCSNASAFVVCAVKNYLLDLLMEFKVTVIWIRQHKLAWWSPRNVCWWLPSVSSGVTRGRGRTAPGDSLEEEERLGLLHLKRGLYTEWWTKRGRTGKKGAGWHPPGGWHSSEKKWQWWAEKGRQFSGENKQGRYRKTGD